jgi:hypothetical protein
MSYASYLSSCGVRKGEFNPFVMNKQEWAESVMTVDQKRERLNKKLEACQDAWYRCYISGDVLISHAEMNETKAFIALLRFDVENALKDDADSKELLRIMCEKCPHF